MQAAVRASDRASAWPVRTPPQRPACLARRGARAFARTAWPEPTPAGGQAASSPLLPAAGSSGRRRTAAQPQGCSARRWRRVSRVQSVHPQESVPQESQGWGWLARWRQQQRSSSRSSNVSSWRHGVTKRREEGRQGGKGAGRGLSARDRTTAHATAARNERMPTQRSL